MEIPRWQGSAVIAAVGAILFVTAIFRKIGKLWCVSKWKAWPASLWELEELAGHSIETNALMVRSHCLCRFDLVRAA